MFSNINLSRSFQYTIKLLLLPIALVFFATACGDGPASPNEQLDDPRGTIQGEVFDQATGDALSGVQVTVVDSTGADGAEWSATTNENGVFTIEDIPVTADAKSKAESNGGYTNPYTLHLDASSLDNYRDSYKAQVDVVFESTGGDGAVSTDIVSKVKLPLSEQAVTVSGKAHTTDDKTISGATVELYQVINPVVNGDNSTETDMLVATSETGEDGSFTFEGVEEDATVFFKFIDKSDPANVINGITSNYSTPAGSESNASMDLGVVQAQEQDQTGAFYITSVTPAPGSDIATDSSFTFTFNRPVADNAWTDATQGFGSGTFKDAIYFSNDGPKKSPGEVEFSVSWNDDRTELTITPENLLDAHEYTLSTRAAFNNAWDGNREGAPINNGPVANNSGEFVDEYGNALDYEASDYNTLSHWTGNQNLPYSEVEVLDFSTGDNTDAPHTPELALEYNTDVNYDGTATGNATITWDVDESDVPVKEYEVYISQNGGPYEHFDTITENTDHDVNELSETYYATTNNTTPNVIAIFDDQEGAISTDIKIRAISDNNQHGEFSEPVTFEDVVQPTLSSANDLGGGEIEVNYSEPMNRSDITSTSNYSFSNSDITIDSIEYDSSDRVIIAVENENNVSGDLTVEDVADLAGNGIDTDNNSDTL